jgi:hypothetical protein
MDMEKPNLTEPGMKYFIRETLKNCRSKKDLYYNIIWNTGLLLGFVCIICLILAYKKKTKPTKEDIIAKRAQQQAYLLSKVKALNDQKRKKENTLITALPKFESDFALLHKNFFKT